MPEYLHGVRVVEINEGVRPIRTVSTAVIGLIGTAPLATARAAARLDVGVEADDNALRFTAAVQGSGGNQIRVHLRDPLAASQAISVAVAQSGSGADMVSTVTVNLSTDGTGALASTAAQVATAVAAVSAAAALVSVADIGDSDGSGIAAASIKPLALAGGTDDAFPLNAPRLLTAGSDASALGTTGTLPAAVSRIRSQTQAQIVIVRVAEGASASATQANCAGSASLKTGAYALLRAETETGLKPRILGCPEHDVAAVTAALVNVADSLRAMVYAAVHDATTVSAAIAYRAGFGSRRLLLLWPAWTEWDAATSAVATVEPVAYALGLRAKIDNDFGWHKVLSNVALSGPTGVSIGVQFDPHSAASEANLLNADEVTTLVRMDGMRYWGCRTTALDPLFAFESAARTADVIADSIAAAHLWAIDKPMHPTLVRDILEGINTKLRELTRGGYLLGGSAWLDPEANTATTLKDGRLYIDYDYTPVPPLEQLQFNQRITDRYLATFATAVQLAAAA